jgi:hypothetical protein
VRHAKSSLGDAKRSLGDVKKSDTQPAAHGDGRCAMLRARWVTLRDRWVSQTLNQLLNGDGRCAAPARRLQEVSTGCDFLSEGSALSPGKGLSTSRALVTRLCQSDTSEGSSKFGISRTLSTAVRIDPPGAESSLTREAAVQR